MASEYAKLIEFIDYKDGISNYLHNTDERTVAEKIIEDGFEFSETLRNTSDEINGNWRETLPWWNIQRGRYGNFTVVIQIDKVPFNSAGELASHIQSEHILSKDRFWNEEVTDWTYILQPQYVKGYFDRKNNTGEANPIFDPTFFDGDLAERNIKRWDQEEDRIRIFTS